MRTFSSRPQWVKTAQMVAASSFVLSLTACNSNGTVQTSMGDTSGTTPTQQPPIVTPPLPPTAPQATVFTPVQEAVQETSEGLRAVPLLLNDLGDVADNLLGNLPLSTPAPLAGRSMLRSSGPVSPVLSELGLGLDSLVLGVETGAGQLGASSDPIGTTLAGSEGLLIHTGSTIVNAGAALQSLGSSAGPASAITDVAGDLVGGLGELVTQVGGTAGDIVTSTPVTSLTTTVNDAATPIVGALLGTVQNVGVSTGIAQPIDNLLSGIGGLVSSAGSTAQDSATPVVTPVGMLVNQLGNTVTALGGIAGADSTSSGGLLGGGLLGGALAGGDAAANPLAGLLGGSLTQTDNPLSPLTSGLLNGGLLAGLSPTAPGSNPLTPVTGLLGNITGGLGNAGGGAPLAPVTGLLGNLTGGLNSGTLPTSGGIPAGLPPNGLINSLINILRPPQP